MIKYRTTYSSPLGKITLISDDHFLTNLVIDGQKSILSKKDTYRDIEITDLQVFILTKEWLDCYFSNQIPNIAIPLKAEGSPFQKMVWNILKTISYGTCLTYGDIANQIARKKGIKKMSAQAVGNAISKNPISIIIPCHRVIGKNGNLVGYNGGVDLKKKLLELEKKNVIDEQKGTYKIV